MVPRRIPCALLLALHLVMPSLAQAWPHSPSAPMTVNNGLPYGTYLFIVPDGAGGVLCAWSDLRNGIYHVYAQRFDADGKELWTHNGVTVGTGASAQYVSNAVSDGQGGIVIAWQDYRANANGDLYAQRLNASGVAQWTVNGVAVNTTAPYKYTPAMAADRFGGCWFTWEDSRDFGVTGQDIYLQRVTAGGTQAYPANGTAVCALAGHQQEPRIVGDEYGYATLVWTDMRAGNNDVYAQRYYYYDGLAQWVANGLGVCALPSAAYAPQICNPTGSELYVAWTDGRNGNGEIWAQSLRWWDGGGNWAANGVRIATTGVSLWLQGLTSDGSGGLVAAYDAATATGAHSLLAQRFDYTGTTTWAAPGVTLRSGSGFVSSVAMCADGFGGALVAWQDSRADNGDTYVQRLSAAGALRWRAGGLPVGLLGGTQQTAHVAVAPNGGAYVAFDDYGVGRACLMAVDEWGYLGAAPVMHDAADVPNDQGGQVKVSWYGSPLDTDPLYRNIGSYYVFRSVAPQLAARIAPLAAAADGETVAAGGKRWLRTRDAVQDYFWEEVAAVPARHLSTYSAVVPTTGDSIAGSNPRTAFLVEAVTLDGVSYWVTAPDSAYSVDNLAPAAPAPFTGQFAVGSVALHWDPNTEGDLAGYRLYRGTTAGFVPGPGNLVAVLPDTGYAAPAGTPWIYKLTAVDAHGNESPAATLIPSGTLGVGEGAPAAFFFAPPAPNPAPRGGASVLRYGLPAGGRVDLRVYDAAGRLVRTLVAGEAGAGEYRVAWDGADASGRAVPAGLYFAKLVAGGRDASVRLVRID